MCPTAIPVGERRAAEATASTVQSPGPAQPVLGFHVQLWRPSQAQRNLRPQSMSAQCPAQTASPGWGWGWP